MTRTNIIQSITAFMVLLAMVLGGLKVLATKHDVATAMDYTQKVEERLDEKIDSDKLVNLRRALVELKSDHKNEGAVENWEDDFDREMYIQLKTELDLLLQRKAKDNNNPQ